MVLQVAAKAVIVDGRGRVLVLRESGSHITNTQAGRYDLPGGRLEPGEAFLDCLHREVKEETVLEIEPDEPLLVGEWRPIIIGVPHQIIGIFVRCRIKKESVAKLSEEHDRLLWIDPKKYKSYDIVQPAGEAIVALLRK